MTNFFKGVGSAAIVLIVSMAIHIFCNMKGIQLNQVTTGTMSAICAMFLYQGLIRNEKNNE